MTQLSQGADQVERWSLRMHRNELFGGEASAPSVRQALLNQIEYERIKADETATETARAAEAERQMQLKRDREQQAAEDLARIAVRRQAVHMEIAKRFDGKVVNYEARGIFNPRGIPTGRVWIFTLRFKNRSNKPAVGIAGWINITDVFGNDLGSYPFALEPAIEPNGNLDYDAYMEYDSRDARHRAMAAVNRIHYQWFFESIVYRDGTRIDYKTITDSDPGRAGPQKSPARTPTT